MNLQSLVVVILRLMSLNFLLVATVQFAPQILRFTEPYQSLPVDSRPALVMPWLLVVGLNFSAVLLWVCALPIARLVTRGVPHDLSFGALSLMDCYSIAFIGVGLFYITRHLPQVLNWTHYFLTAASGHRDSGEDVSGYDVSLAFIPFVVGVVLFVNGRRWAVALARRQAESSPPVTP